ncbi:conjugal transfer protein TrbI [Azospirillum brasilense]|uniref:Conjugal transfer protein TrbI n=1 Tax=Azospirillum brasilense TaxID=192 RepID=A0A4D8QJU7_AZOBR|nr:TrbI/VirB10 family protein [Azospirillum argentinense]MBF5093762.1 conjugal transfer protein TrbI [Azospirillum sp. INR13]MBK3798247.1 conjugal transfer protein TrbI [Azospirillum argentinense]QCO05882.1 conjugal transfer protein TrbI [Azospirillum argentinense]
MTSVNDTPPPLPPDPLTRHRVITSGPHVVRILLVAAAVIGLGLAAYMLGRSQGGGSLPKLSVALGPTQPELRLPSYEDMAPKPAPAPPPAPRIEKKEPPPPARPQAKAPPKEDELRKKAMEAGVGGWSRKEEGTTVAAAQAGTSDFVAAGSDCLVPPGTPIPLLTVNRVVTERGGIVTAHVTQDVWDAGFSCLAVPGGSVVTLDVGSGVTRGQTRIEVANPVITRPWPRNDTVRVAAVGADVTGAAGLAGSVEVPWLQTGLLIAASTAVDVAAAALTGGGSLIGGILGHSIDRPLDKAAKDLLGRAPVITLDAGEPVLLLLRGGLKADDFDRAR